eukprot:5246432-Prymnesium_polylepis.2
MEAEVLPVGEQVQRQRPVPDAVQLAVEVHLVVPQRVEADAAVDAEDVAHMWRRADAHEAGAQPVQPTRVFEPVVLHEQLSRRDPNRGRWVQRH